MKEEKKKVTDVSLWSVLESVLCLSERTFIHRNTATLTCIEECDEIMLVELLPAAEDPLP